MDKNVSLSLPASDCAVLGKQGLWDKLTSCDDAWIDRKLQAIGNVPLGPYVLSLDHADESLSLIHAIEFRRQIKKGADLESMGTLLITSKEQAAWFAKARGYGLSN